MAYQSQEFYSQAARRLARAVIHQAIMDVLENAEEAEEAKQWLSGRDCDSLLEACGCDYLVAPLARLLATAQVRPGDLLLIDRHPGEQEFAFMRDTEQWSSFAQRPFAASHLGPLAAAEGRSRG